MKKIILSTLLVFSYLNAKEFALCTNEYAVAPNQVTCNNNSKHKKLNASSIAEMYKNGWRLIAVTSSPTSNGYITGYYLER